MHDMHSYALTHTDTHTHTHTHTQIYTQTHTRTHTHSWGDAESAQLGHNSREHILTPALIDVSVLGGALVGRSI